MGQQEAVFLESEGDAWHNRNKDKPFSSLRNELIIRTVYNASSVIEVGCGDGRYLANLRSMYGGDCDKFMGIDPSAEAVHAASMAYPDIKFNVGTASSPTDATRCDLLIYGFCLYVCDPESLQNVAAIGDSILGDGGHLIIHDFDPEYPHKVPYHHVPGLFSYKMDYSKLWLANPAYSLVSKTVIGDGTAVWVLKKDVAAGWPEEELS